MLAFILGGALLLAPSVSEVTAPTQESTDSSSAALYWDVPLSEVQWTGAMDDVSASRVENLLLTTIAGYSTTRVVLEGRGEAYTLAPKRENDDTSDMPPVARILACAPLTVTRGASISGTVLFNEFYAEPLKLEFELPLALADHEARETFLRARSIHHGRLMLRNIPGRAWFRHQADESATDTGGDELDPFLRSRGEVQETFELFSGGRAVAENLQLDRLLPRDRATAEDEQPEPDVKLDTIEGIVVSPFDWTPFLEDVGDVQLDPLLAWIPEDQHVLLTPSFNAFVQLVDELELRASPLVAMMEASSSSAGSRAALEEQLTLSLDGLARILGPSLIKSVAITGGDLYMRTGTDVTLLFDCRQVAPVVAHLRSRHTAAAAGDSTVISTNTEGVEGVRSPFGRISSFFTVRDNVVLVSNSRAALKHMEGAQTGHNLSALDETRFFRHRYPLGGEGAEATETAFVLISDATIRRWCGPRWRIAASRRLRALAALLDIQASHIAEAVAGFDQPIPLNIDDPRYGDLGQVTLTAQGVHSSIWGSTNSLNPIVEMEFDSVSAREAQLYGRWRDGYARNWSGGFDPIAARLIINEEVFEGDLTVMPLIDNTDYRELRSFSRQARLKPYDGDPHAGTLFHFALAIDPESPEVLELQSLLSGFAPGEVANVLGWMSGSVALFADEDDIWDVVLEAEDIEEAMDDLFVELNDLPVVISIGSNSALKLAGWMTALRGFAEGSAPGLTHWSTEQDEAGNSYVKIAGEELFDNEEHLLYATLREALVISLNEDTLLRTMTRYKSRRAAANDTTSEATDGPTEPQNTWLGESAVMRISRQGIAIWGSMMGDSIGKDAQRRTFGNLPILNEWKRLFPDRDPVEVHARVFGQELSCAAGGEFVWDDEWKTMASSVLGHPSAPKPAPHLPPAIGDLQSIDAGLTFEEDGLRARVRARR